MRVDLEDAASPGPVRRLHGDAAIEASGAQQRRVEDLGPVRGAEHDDGLGSTRSRPSRSGSGRASARARRWRRVRLEAPWRDRPMASSSSMKMIDGAASFALLNRSRTRAAPTPTIASMNSDAAIEKYAACASPATARASSVLPVPGGPYSSTPCGMRPPSLTYLSGVRRKSTISASSAFASSMPATSVEGDRDLLRIDATGLRATEAAEEARAARPRARAGRPDDEQADEQQRRSEAEQQLGRSATCRAWATGR